MAIPDPALFTQNTAPLKKRIGPLSFGPRYGSNMALVTAALQYYWDHRNDPIPIREQLLYGLWKQCRKWLKLKEAKIDPSELFSRRKSHIESLRDEALAELANISPRVERALRAYEQTKTQGPYQYQMKPLAQGYSRERELYLQGGKLTGSSVSHSQVHTMMDPQNLALLQAKQHKKFNQLTTKGFGDLTQRDVSELQKLFPNAPGGWDVAFMNKIGRMRFLVEIDTTGVQTILRDLAGAPLSITATIFGGSYALAMYAMDRYGNLFINVNHTQGAPFVNVTTLQQQQATFFNHSSFLGGREILCAGCCHVGYDAGRRQAVPGVLSAIDNASGHYKPSTEHLVNCVHVLHDEGIDVTNVRVGDFAHTPARFYWGNHFLGNDRGNFVWPSGTNAQGFLRVAPPIAETSS
jgi:hypothetical protein